MSTETPRPVVARAVDTLASLGSLLLISFVLWRQFDPDFDPREFALSIYDRVRAEVDARRAIYRTLVEIEQLPERREEP